MTKVELPFVKSYRDRHKTWRFYFRRKDFPTTPLPGFPGTQAFMAAYQAALDASEGGERNKGGRPPKPAVQLDPESMSWLIQRYYSSAAYRTLGDVTKASYAGMIDRIEKAHGPKPFKRLDRKGVKKIVSDLSETPGSANYCLRMLKMLMNFAIDEELRTDNPCVRVKKLKVAGDGFIAWSDEDIEKFERRWPAGTKPHLALTILLHTAQRRTDIVAFGRHRIRGNHIALRQSKTGEWLEAPLHPELADALRVTPIEAPAFLMTAFGKPYTPAGFGNWFGDRCRDAGLGIGFNGHGLRKAAARRLAEAGCTTLEIMAITGHKSIEEVETYVRAANKKKLAASAVAKLQQAAGV